MSLHLTTWEQRRTMTASELIAAMGPLHVMHADYQPRGMPSVPMPNLAGRLPVIEVSDISLVGQWRQILRGVAA